ncbi:MAG: ATP-dependent DNA helicase RecG [Ruminiclostridium sp.]|nr:ATP-dependent DNA helicase RecG [Ruminiclostridium sp.]
MSDLTLHTPVSQLPGIGPAREASLAKLGLCTVADLLAFFPRDYEDRTVRENIWTLPLEEPVCFAAMVAEPFRTSFIRKGMDLTKGRVVDGTAQVDITFFNQSYVRNLLQTGETYYFYGKLTGQAGFRRQMVNPIFEKEGSTNFTGGIMPVYPLTAGIAAKRMADLQRHAARCVDQIRETLPEDIRRAHDLAPAQFSYRAIHFPENWEELQRAQRRLMFEELFCLNLGLTLIRGRRSQHEAIPFTKQDLGAFTHTLPFTLTDAQLRSAREAAGDLAQPIPMNRLLQGDVGSGKTVVAAACAYLAWENGCQAALMAPTELLAQQHAKTMADLLGGTGMHIALLTGSMTAAQKRHCRQALEAGEIDLIVGTHALLSEGVEFRRLGLVITDEQHRFGVDQRAALSAKSGGEFRPHVLVMSATPIPRTLALMIYGDLDLSVIDQLPPGRTPVDTMLIGEDKRQRLYGFVRKQVGLGRQVYIVCPAVDQEDEEGMKAAEQFGRTLQKDVFPDLRVAIVHGKMKAADKQTVMASFAGGETDVLVSTTVIEVGVDVPNASLMIIENADRFGLSQLHQLRGRVGRGQHQSYCVLISDNRNETTRKRLKTLCATTDGFLIAEEDLKMRGPGDFFGSRQHGLPQLKLASLEGDMRLLHQAQDAARALLTKDPDLTHPDHEPLRGRVEQLFRENRDIFN